MKHNQTTLPLHINILGAMRPLFLAILITTPGITAMEKQNLAANPPATPPTSITLTLPAPCVCPVCGHTFHFLKSLENHAIVHADGGLQKRILSHLAYLCASQPAPTAQATETPKAAPSLPPTSGESRPNTPHVKSRLRKHEIPNNEELKPHKQKKKVTFKTPLTSETPVTDQQELPIANSTIPATALTPTQNLCAMLRNVNWEKLVKKEEPYEYSPTCPWPNLLLARGHVGTLINRVTPPVLNAQPNAYPELRVTHHRAMQQKSAPDTAGLPTISTDTPEITSDDWLQEIRTSDAAILHELFGHIQ